MGWSRGSQIMSSIIGQLHAHMPDEAARTLVYEVLIECFEDMDWDTQGESMGEDPVFDAVMKDLHPGWFEEEEEE